MTVETSPQQPATRTEAFKAIWEILEEDPLTCQKSACLGEAIEVELSIYRQLLATTWSTGFLSAESVAATMRALGYPCRGTLTASL
jgi:hypothetical protein